MEQRRAADALKAQSEVQMGSFCVPLKVETLHDTHRQRPSQQLWSSPLPVLTLCLWGVRVMGGGGCASVNLCEQTTCLWTFYITPLDSSAWMDGRGTPKWFERF